MVAELFIKWPFINPTVYLKIIQTKSSAQREGPDWTPVPSLREALALVIPIFTTINRVTV